MENYLADIKSFYKGKRVLVTGHTGFKGSWLTFWLSSLGAKVYGYSLSPENESLYKIADIADRDVYKEKLGDIRDFESFAEFFAEAKPEVVFHLAAQPIVSEGYAYPRMTFETNVMGTVNVLECIRLAPETVKSVVVITTDKVYDDEFDQVGGFKEDDPLNGYDPYSNSKSCADLATQCYADSFLKKSNIPVTIFRAGNVIGGGDFAKNRIIPDFIRAWRKGESLELRQPYSIRPYQHVIEPLFAYLVMGATQAQDNISDIYNVGPNADNCVTTESLIGLMSEHFTGAKYKYTNSTFRENPKLTLNVDHIKENGIFPLWNIETTIEKTAEWYLTNSEYEWEFTQVRELMSKQIDEYCKLAGVKDE